MIGYNLIILKDLLNEIGEEDCKKILSQFSCPLNEDVENFLKYKAIEFAKQDIASTHLVFSQYKGIPELIAFFSLATKSVFIGKSNISKNFAKRIARFSQYDQQTKRYYLAMHLIGQLGKNFRDGLNQLISGEELLKIACDKVKEAQRITSGKYVYLECEDKPKLIQFYEDNGFSSFGKRNLDKDETEVLSGNYLVQLVKKLDD